MRTCYFLLLSSLLFVQCKPNSSKTAAAPEKSMKTFIDQFYRDRLVFYPLEATTQGVEGYNDQLPITVSEAYRQQLRD